MNTSESDIKFEKYKEPGLNFGIRVCYIKDIIHIIMKTTIYLIYFDMWDMPKDAQSLILALG